MPREPFMSLLCTSEHKPHPFFEVSPRIRVVRAHGVENAFTTPPRVAPGRRAAAAADTASEATPEAAVTAFVNFQHTSRCFSSHIAPKDTNWRPSWRCFQGQATTDTAASNIAVVASAHPHISQP